MRLGTRFTPFFVLVGATLVSFATVHAAVERIPVGALPRAVAVADLDRDGDLDVVVANSGSGDATILLNGGSGRLAPAPHSPVPAGSEPSDVVIADFNRDGKLDPAFPNHETSLVTVLVGDGRAGFQPMKGSPFDTGARPHIHGLAAADFDGDGWVDIATDSADEDCVRVLFGVAGGFGPAVKIETGRLPYYLVGQGDVLGDSLVELLVPNQRDRTISVIGKARGPTRLGPAVPPVGVPRKAWMVTAADVNGDGHGDLVAVVDDGVAVLLGSKFEAAPGSPFALRGATEVATGDLDGDGIADIAIGSWDGDSVTVILGRSFARRAIRTARRSVGLAIADLDGDGRGELLAASMVENALVVTRLER
jgi:hypothetical protein